MIENRYKKGYGYPEDCQSYIMALDFIKIDTASKIVQRIAGETIQKSTRSF